MNLLNNVKLCSVEALKTNTVEVPETPKTEIQYDSTQVVKKAIDSSKQETSNNEISIEHLMPLDPSFSAKRKPDNIPSNIYISRSSNGDPENLILKYYVYLNKSSNESITFLLNFFEMVNERCEVTLELDNMHIDITDGLALLSSMDACKSKITVVGNVINNLMDLAIFAIADERIVSDVSFIRLTNLKSGAGGNISDMKVNIDYISGIENKIKRILIEKQIITEDQAKEVFDNNDDLLLAL